MVRFEILAMLMVAGCTDTQSSAAEINRASTWQISFERIVDLGSSPYVELQPAPEYPMRTMRSPITDAASCSPGCTCAFVAAIDSCYGDVGQTCNAIGGFTETCADAQTLLDCSNVTFTDNTSTIGVCVLEDLAHSDSFGYITLQRYQVTFELLAYD